MLELMNAHQLAAFGEADYTADDLRTWLTTPYVEVDRDIRVLERDGRLIGYVDADPTRDDPPLWWCDVKVDPDAHAGEVVAELVTWLEERAVEGRLRVWTSEDDVRIVDAFGALGFEPVRHSYRMEIDLADEASPSRSGRRGSPCAHGLGRRPPLGLRRLHRGLAGHERPDRRDLRGVGALARRARLVRPYALVSRDGGRRARGLLALPGRSRRPESRLRQPARRPAAVAPAGSRRGTPAPLVRRVPRTWADAGNARCGRRERHRRDPPVRACGNARLSQHRLSRTGRRGSRLSA